MEKWMWWFHWGNPCGNMRLVSFVGNRWQGRYSGSLALQDPCLVRVLTKPLSSSVEQAQDLNSSFYLDWCCVRGQKPVCPSQGVTTACKVRWRWEGVLSLSICGGSRLQRCCTGTAASSPGFQTEGRLEPTLESEQHHTVKSARKNGRFPVWRSVLITD